MAASPPSSTPSMPLTLATPQHWVSMSMGTAHLATGHRGSRAPEITDMLIRSGALDVVVIDSVTALVPKAEIEGEMGDVHMGLRARLMSQALRKLAGSRSTARRPLRSSSNQLREKIGVMFRKPRCPPGGRALKFYSSVRMGIRRVQSIKEVRKAVGNRVVAKVVKNKGGATLPQRPSSTSCSGKASPTRGSLLDVAAEHDVVRKSGAWYTFDGAPARSGPGERPAVPSGEP